MLLFALFLAVLRSLPGPVFTPLRIFSAGYTDIFRGMPTILVIILLGYGMPSLGLQGVPNSEYLWAVVALSLVYSAYVAEVYRAGIQSVHPSQVAAARSLGLSRWQSMRHVVLPQAVRRVIAAAPERLHRPPEGLRARRVPRRGREPATGDDHPASGDFNFTPFVALALVYIVITIPQARFVDSDDRTRPAPAPGGGGAVTESVRIEGLHKSFGDLEVLKGIDLVVDKHEVVCLIGASGSGKSTLLRCINLLEPIDAGTIAIDGIEITARGVDVDAVRRRIGIVFQAFNLFPHMTVLRNVALSPEKVRKLASREAEDERPGAARTVRPRGQGRRLPGSALGRAAAARRDRPGARDAARHPPAGRGHERLGPGAGRRGAGRDPGARRAGDDDGHRDPRDGVRAGRGERRRLPP